MILSNQKIEILLGDRMMTPRQFADSAGLPYNTLNRAKRGEKVSSLTAGKIARALGVSVRDIAKEAD